MFYVVFFFSFFLFLNLLLSPPFDSVPLAAGCLFVLTFYANPYPHGFLYCRYPCLYSPFPHFTLYSAPCLYPLPAIPPSGDSNCTVLGEDGAEVPSIAQSLPHSECQRVESGCDVATSPSHTGGSAPFTCKRRRTRAGRSQAACPPLPRSLRSPLSFDCPSPLRSGGAKSLSDLALCGLDESWFITPPPCFTAEGVPAEASPMEDLLIEHPSMSVYVSSSNMEQSTANMADSVR